MEGWDFSHIGNAWYVSFDNSTLRGVNAEGTRFMECSFKNADLTGARMSFDKFNNNRQRLLTEEQLRTLENFHEDMLEPLFP